MINSVIICILWILCSSLTPEHNINVLRRVKTVGNLSELLIWRGNSISGRDIQEIASKVQVISFDWGGVLDLVFISDESYRSRLGEVFAELKDNGIQLVIVSEGSPERIRANLKNLGWEDYFEVRQSLEFMASLTKRTVLGKIAEEKGIESDTIIHFDDSPQILENLGYPTGGKNILGVGVVGWREKDEEFKARSEELFPHTPWVVTDLKSIYEVLVQILKYNSSKLYHHSP